MASSWKRPLPVVFALFGVGLVGVAAWFAWGLTDGLGVAGSIVAALAAAMLAGGAVLIAWFALWGQERPADPVDARASARR
jgi:hypothetical protein